MGIFIFMSVTDIKMTTKKNQIESYIPLDIQEYTTRSYLFEVTKSITSEYPEYGYALDLYWQYTDDSTVGIEYLMRVVKNIYTRINKEKLFYHFQHILLEKMHLGDYKYENFSKLIDISCIKMYNKQCFRSPLHDSYVSSGKQNIIDQSYVSTGIDSLAFALMTAFDHRSRVGQFLALVKMTNRRRKRYITDRRNAYLFLFILPVEIVHIITKYLSLYNSSLHI